MRTRKVDDPLLMAKRPTTRGENISEAHRVLVELTPLALKRVSEILKASKNAPLVWRAAEAVLDRVLGKAAQPLVLSEIQKRFQAMPDDELKAYILRGIEERMQQQPEVQPGAKEVKGVH